MSTIFFAQDFANYSRYEKDNVKVKSQNTVPNAVLWEILLREGWVNNDPKFFTDNNFVGRGILDKQLSNVEI